MKRSKRVTEVQFNLLEKEDLNAKYRISARNKFEVLDTLTKFEERWQKMKESITEVIEKRANKKWMTPEILDFMKDKRKVKNKKLKYNEIDKRIKRKCNETWEKWINSQCIEIDEQTIKDSKYMHQKINEMTGKNPSSRIGCLKS